MMGVISHCATNDVIEEIWAPMDLFRVQRQWSFPTNFWADVSFLLWNTFSFVALLLFLESTVMPFYFAIYFTFVIYEISSCYFQLGQIAAEIMKRAGDDLAKITAILGNGKTWKIQRYFEVVVHFSSSIIRWLP